jgi:pimeloyl-ACP methyl ester carboxylesterase
MKRGYIDLPESQVHYLRGGAGDNLLLLHQTGQSSDEYARMIPALVKKFHVIAMDTPGYGKSDRPAVKFTHEDYARTVIAFLKALGISRVSIIGHLTGASLAVEVAATSPTLVEKLVLIDLPFYSLEMRKSRQENAHFQGQAVKPDGSHITELWKLFSNLTPGARVETLNSAVINAMLAGDQLHAGHQALFRYELEKRLPLVKCPSLLISGSEAPLHQRIDAVLELKPRWPLIKITGGGDMLPLERPDECNRAILEFLK